MSSRRSHSIRMPPSRMTRWPISWPRSAVVTKSLPIQEGARPQARSARERAELESSHTRLGLDGAGEALGRFCLHETCSVAERSRHKFEREQPYRIHGAGQPDLTGRNRHEAEPAVIGHVPYEHDEAKALRARTR